MGMRCIRCDTANSLRDRTNNQGRCKTCGHPFVFEPATMEGVKFTDGFFAKAIADISANNTLYFTPRQLSYLLCKRLNNKTAGVTAKVPSLFWIFLIFAIVSTIHNNSSPINLLVFLVVLILVFFAPEWFNFSKIVDVFLGRDSRSFALSEEQFQEWLNAWLRVNEIPKMLPSTFEDRSATPISSDISAYSFDRAVICDSDAIAQLLIANNFHFENNCAMLSTTGYPQSIFDTVMQMLHRNPELKVYAIHDASPSGVTMVHHLRTSPDWFENRNVTIYELGLLPRQILSKRDLFVQTSEESAQQAKLLPEQVRQTLSSNELKWLEDGKYLELESFSPRRIINVLTQGITRSQDTTASDSLIIIDEDGGYVYTSESFG